MPTVVPEFSQKIPAFSRPFHPSLPPERSLRSAHRLSESPSHTSDFHTPRVPRAKRPWSSGRVQRTDRKVLWSSPFFSYLEPQGNPAQRLPCGEEEGDCGYGAFAAPGGSVMQQPSSDEAAILFFLKKRKKRMGAQNFLAEKEKNGFKKAYPWVWRKAREAGR